MNTTTDRFDSNPTRNYNRNSNIRGEGNNSHSVELNNRNGSANTSNEIRGIEDIGNIMTWKDGPKRYLLRNMLTAKMGKVDGKITMNDVPSVVIWSLIYMKSKRANLPMCTVPNTDYKIQAMKWLKDFRSKVVSHLMNLARNKYFEEAMKITGDFRDLIKNKNGLACYSDMQKATENANDELVS